MYTKPADREHQKVPFFREMRENLREIQPGGEWHCFGFCGQGLPHFSINSLVLAIRFGVY